MSMRVIVAIGVIGRIDVGGRAARVFIFALTARVCGRMNLQINYITKR